MSDMSETVRLAKPRKKGLLSLIFSRFFVIVLALLAELAIFASAFFLLSEYIPHIVVVLTIFVFIMLIYLFNSKMDSTAKLSWMFFISITHVAGAIVLFFYPVQFWTSGSQRECFQGDPGYEAIDPAGS